MGVGSSIETPFFPPCCLQHTEQQSPSKKWSAAPNLPNPTALSPLELLLLLLLLLLTATQLPKHSALRCVKFGRSQDPINL